MLCPKQSCSSFTSAIGKRRKMDKDFVIISVILSIFCISAVVGLYFLLKTLDDVYTSTPAARQYASSTHKPVIVVASGSSSAGFSGNTGVSGGGCVRPSTETLNALGAYKCASDCDCVLGRSCSLAGWCYDCPHPQDETKNTLGAFKCASDCDCAVGRKCSTAGWCGDVVAD